jgi:putative membrane protein
MAMNRIPMVLMAAAALTACGGEPPEEELAVPASEAPAAETAPAVTDPQIAAIVVAANDVDIEAGELARTRASDPEVRSFAERMVTDHTGVNEAATELVTRLGVTPETSATSEQLRAGGEENLRALRDLSGAAFDRAYIDQEVAYHQSVLDAINGTLIPNATNDELRALLEQGAAAVGAHLEHARQLQASMGGA